MADTVKHKFTSGKSDGADATQVRPSNWNAEHALSGGANGALLRRDTGTTDGGNWLASVAAGSVLVSNGTAAPPIYSASPTLTSLVLTGSDASLRLASPNAQLLITAAGDPGWGTNVSAVQIGVGGSVMTANSAAGFDLELAANTYHDSTAYRYVTSSHAAKIQIATGPRISFYTAASGGAGTAITFTEHLRLDGTASAGLTGLLLSVAGAAVQRVSVGANDSGGTGFRVLRVAN